MMPTPRSRKTGKRVTGAGDSAESRMLVLFEDMSGKIDAVHEGLLGLERRLIARMDAMEARLVARIEALEVAVRQNSADIRQHGGDIRKNGEATEALRRELAEVRSEVRQNASAAELARLERRVDALEKRVGST